MAKRDKTLSYRRAVWLGAKPHDLEALLRKAFAELPKVAQRKFKRGDGQVLKGIRSLPQRGGGFYVHVVAETPGDHASTLSAAHDELAEGMWAPPRPQRVSSSWTATSFST